MAKYCLLIIAAMAITSTTIFAQPIIKSFSPISGPVGTPVTIKGNGFDSIGNNNVVFFGAVRAGISSATDTTIDVIVPAGATYQPITVTDSAGTSYSSLPFCVT